MTENNQELIELMERLNYRRHKDGYWIREAYTLEPSHSNRIYDDDAQKILKEAKDREFAAFNKGICEAYAELNLDKEVKKAKLKGRLEAEMSMRDTFIDLGFNNAKKGTGGAELWVSLTASLSNNSDKLQALEQGEK